MREIRRVAVRGTARNGERPQSCDLLRRDPSSDVPPAVRAQSLHLSDDQAVAVSLPSSATTEMPSPLIHFEGDWSAAERAPIETAAEEAEATGLPDPTDTLGAPWVATRQALGDTRLYMAARQQGSSAMMDRSAEGLAARIRRYAEQRASSSDNPPPEALFQLVYESTETDAMTEADLRDLLLSAREKNDDLSVTGLLLYAQGRFLQVLEGPESTVRDLFATIQDDARHTDVEILLTMSTTERTFPDWEMGLERPGAFVNLDGISSFLQSGDLPSAAEPLSEVLEALRQFRRGTSRA